MATIKPVIVPAKALKGGRHKIRISLSHNGEFRYLLTDIVLDSDKEFKNGQIVKRHDASLLNTRLRGILQDCQKTIDAIKYKNGLTCSELVELIKEGGKCKRRTLRSVYDELMQMHCVADGTSKYYAYQFSVISSVLGEEMLVENITRTSVLALDRHLRKMGLRNSTMRGIMAAFARIVSFASKSGYATYARDPFLGYQKPMAEIRDAWLSVEQVKAIRDYETRNKHVAFARDLFMLSYYLGGINMADLVDLDLRKDTVKYQRSKTRSRNAMRSFVQFGMPSEARDLAQRLIGEDGKLRLTVSQRERRCAALLRRCLGRLSVALGIPNLIYYSARKSFSQHAYQLGISGTTIDYILGHSVNKSGSCLYHYVTATPEMATKAIRKVLDNLK